MTAEEFRDKMKQLKDEHEWDKEVLHIEMDELLLKCLREAGYDEGCDIFENQDKWYA